MKALVVYDSWYGDTEKIAKAIASGLGVDAQVIKVDKASEVRLEYTELLIAGSPTHGGVPTPGMNKFLNSLGGDELEGIAVTAFDTRATYRWLKIIGFAAPKIAKHLQQKGATLITPPEGFYVSGKEGPLQQGEVERARLWAERVAESLTRVAA